MLVTILAYTISHSFSENHSLGPYLTVPSVEVRRCNQDYLF